MKENICKTIIYMNLFIIFSIWISIYLCLFYGAFLLIFLVPSFFQDFSQTEILSLISVFAGCVIFYIINVSEILNPTYILKKIKKAIILFWSKKFNVENISDVFDLRGNFKIFLQTRKEVNQ